MKVLSGIGSILIIVVAYVILKSSNGWTSGGLIIILPLIWLIQWIWTSFVNPKPKNIITNTNIVPTEDNISDVSYKANDIPIYSTPTESNSKLSIFTRLINFLTFNNSTYRSVFSEGNRRILLILSIITPIVFLCFAVLFNIEFLIVASPFIYIVYHTLILLYIWVQEGNNNVLPGGNALKTLKNLLLSQILIGIIGIVLFSGAYYYYEVYVPQELNKKESSSARIKKKSSTRIIQDDYINMPDRYGVELLQSGGEGSRQVQVTAFYLDEHGYMDDAPSKACYFFNSAADILWICSPPGFNIEKVEYYNNENTHPASKLNDQYYVRIYNKIQNKIFVIYSKT